MFCDPNYFGQEFKNNGIKVRKFAHIEDSLQFLSFFFGEIKTYYKDKKLQFLQLLFLFYPESGISNVYMMTQLFISIYTSNNLTSY